MKLGSGWYLSSHLRKQVWTYEVLDFLVFKISRFLYFFSSKKINSFVVSLTIQGEIPLPKIPNCPHLV